MCCTALIFSLCLIPNIWEVLGSIGSSIQHGCLFLPIAQDNYVEHSGLSAACHSWMSLSHGRGTKCDGPQSQIGIELLVMVFVLMSG